MLHHPHLFFFSDPTLPVFNLVFFSQLLYPFQLLSHFLTANSTFMPASSPLSAYLLSFRSFFPLCLLFVYLFFHLLPHLFFVPKIIFPQLNPLPHRVFPSLFYLVHPICFFLPTFFPPNHSYTHLLALILTHTHFLSLPLHTSSLLTSANLFPLAHLTPLPAHTRNSDVTSLFLV